MSLKLSFLFTLKVMKNGTAFNQVEKAFTFKLDPFLRDFQDEEKF